MRTKSLSRQTLNLDKRQFARLQSKGRDALFLLVKPSHKVTRQQLVKGAKQMETHGSDVKSCSSVLEAEVDGRTETKSYSIGRRTDNDLVLDDPLISSRHLTLKIHSEYKTDSVSSEGAELDLLQVWYETVDTSTNGTHLNGRSMEKGKVYTLNDGDEIAFPVSSRNKQKSHSFIFITPKHGSEDFTKFNSLYRNEKDMTSTLDSEELNETLFKEAEENNFNSLNLEIINETQQKLKKKPTKHYSASSLSFNLYSRNNHSKLLELKNIRRSIVELTSSLASAVYLINDKLRKTCIFQQQNEKTKDTQSIAEILEEISHNHSQTQCNLKDLLHRVVEDFSQIDDDEVHKKATKWRDLFKAFN